MKFSAGERARPQNEGGPLCLVAEGGPSFAFTVPARSGPSYYFSCCHSLHDAADKALGEAGLADFADVSVTGIDAPREARLNLVADRAETPDLATMPGRIRDALLRDFLITLDVAQGYPLGKNCPKGPDGRITVGFVDEVLLDGEPVRLVRIEPRA